MVTGDVSSWAYERIGAPQKVLLKNPKRRRRHRVVVDHFLDCYLDLDQVLLKLFTIARVISGNVMEIM